MPIIMQCGTCKNYIGLGYCTAFGSKHIPSEILKDIVDHDKPYKGDNGIRYEFIGGPKEE